MAFDAAGNHDYERAVHLYLPCANSGDPEYEFAVGFFELVWLEDQRALQRPRFSYSEPLRWIRRAVDSNDTVSRAAAILRDGYRFGRYSLPKDEGLATCWDKVANGNQSAGDCIALEQGK